jgi:hypothetical protein
MGLKAKWEYFRAIYERYRQADRKTKQAILSEFCLNTRYHRKYAIRLLNGPAPGKRSQDAGHARRRGCSYGQQTLGILAHAKSRLSNQAAPHLDQNRSSREPEIRYAGWDHSSFLEDLPRKAFGVEARVQYGCCLPRLRFAQEEDHTETRQFGSVSQASGSNF